MSLNPPIPDWTNRVVWLIGASTGIGAATAHRLHQRGARVIVSARSGTALNAFVAQHPGSMALPLDVTDADAMKTALDALLARHGQLDLVAYCAGHYQAMRATQFNLAEARRHQDINVTGALNMLDVARKCRKLKQMVSVSTAYVTPHQTADTPVREELVRLFTPRREAAE